MRGSHPVGFSGYSAYLTLALGTDDSWMLGVAESVMLGVAERVRLGVADTLTLGATDGATELVACAASVSPFALPLTCSFLVANNAFLAAARLLIKDFFCIRTPDW